MKKLLKNMVNRIFKMMYGKKCFYNFFYFLYTQSLKGMEHGTLHANMQDNGELKVIKLLQKLTTHPVVFDGGANVGNYTSACIQVLGKDVTIYAFEPLSQNFKLLQENFSTQTGVYLHQMALSDKNDTITIHYNENHPRLSSAIVCNFDHYGFYLDKTEQVDAVSIEFFCQNNQIPHIHLLKLDLEGYDYFALKGANNMILNQNIDLIQFEMGRPNVDSKTFFKDFYLLLKDSYDLYRILSFGFVKMSEYSYEYEIFLGCNLLAVNKKLNLIIS